MSEAASVRALAELNFEELLRSFVAQPDSISTARLTAVRYAEGQDQNRSVLSGTTLSATSSTGATHPVLSA